MHTYIDTYLLIKGVTETIARNLGQLLLGRCRWSLRTPTPFLKEQFTFYLQYNHSGTLANRKYINLIRRFVV